jgi:hypothetical protein
MAMSRNERMRFLQGAAFAVGLTKCGHEAREILERLDLLARGWNFGPKETDLIRTTFDEAMHDALKAERIAWMH